MSLNMHVGAVEGSVVALIEIGGTLYPFRPTAEQADAIGSHFRHAAAEAREQAEARDSPPNPKPNEKGMKAHVEVGVLNAVGGGPLAVDALALLLRRPLDAVKDAVLRLSSRGEVRVDCGVVSLGRAGLQDAGEARRAAARETILARRQS